MRGWGAKFVSRVSLLREALQFTRKFIVRKDTRRIYRTTDLVAGLNVDHTAYYTRFHSSPSPGTDQLRKSSKRLPETVLTDPYRRWLADNIQRKLAAWYTR